MTQNLPLAHIAASHLFSDVEALVFKGQGPVGEQIYTGTRRGKLGTVTVTVNPNGAKAAVECKSKRNTDYRIFKVEDLPLEELQ